MVEDHVAFEAEVAGEEDARLLSVPGRLWGPGDDHRVEHHFLVGWADLVAADVQVYQQAPAGRLLDELDAGQGDACVVHERLARFQPELDHVLPQDAGDCPATLAG